MSVGYQEHTLRYPFKTIPEAFKWGAQCPGSVHITVQVAAPGDPMTDVVLSSRAARLALGLDMGLKMG